MGINMNISLTSSRNYTYLSNPSSNVENSTSRNNENPSQQTSSDNNELFVKIRISNNARQLFYDFRANMSKEAATQRKIELDDALANFQDIHPLENDFQIKGVHYTFQQGSLEYIVANALDGKSVNPSLYASELGKAIRSTVSMPNATIEERAIYRETALKNAQHIAENYFDNEEEATAFINKIKQFAENDILREKGYNVIDNSGIKPFASYSNALNPGEVSFSALAKRYFDEDFNERFINGDISAEEFNKFYLEIANNKTRWENEIKLEFENSVKNVDEIIANIESEFNSVTNDNKTFEDVISNLLINIDQPEIAQWHRNLLKLLS
ncbi:hypothetical protein [Desulfuribacillus alkaliarsenatis]|uniref:DUF5610 domain-containing protein n=1 Tax=Desulfuribacillus alkaliarsenatis TaxID=766136 RepID=A0A1E5G279_9FIRM|nr:hypothetical protein [Desulfuribacillus alkaliarsenatis]OEF97098.1 hypothetical protein BHF68_05735 [Desulfuribacillus alkaliarsenatis]